MKILFTTVFRPFGVDGEYGSALTFSEFHQAHLTRYQGPFAIRGNNPSLGLHFIANNIEVSSVVLEYPTLEEFEEELLENQYDYVGITCGVATVKKAIRMAELIREISPKSRTIVGGHGTVVPGVEESFDFVCRGEGVKFMRNLLGEYLERPINHPFVYNTETQVLGVRFRPCGMIAAGLGCPNRCEFCSTSYYFDCKHLPFLSDGKEIYELMMAMGAKLRHTFMDALNFMIIEEDFLLDKKRVEEFGKYAIKSPIPLSFACFASAKSVSQYDPEYLARIGMTSVWIGVESKFARYPKLSGINMKDLFEQLRNSGIKTIGSLMLGFNFHNQQTIHEDISYLISLEPTFAPFAICCPIPSTPYYERMKRKGRIISNDWNLYNGFHCVIDHPNFTPKELEEILHRAYQRDFTHLGPSILRALEVDFLGYQRFKNKSDDSSRKRAEFFRKRLFYEMALLPIIKDLLGPTMISNRVDDLSARISREITNYTFMHFIGTNYIRLMRSLRNLQAKLYQADISHSTKRSHYPKTIS